MRKLSKEKQAIKNRQIEVLATLTTVLKEMEHARAMIENVLLGQGHIVVIDKLGCFFTIEEGKITGVTTCLIHKCNRFSKEDAERIAPTVRNGAGSRGVAVHIRTALDQSILEQRELLESMKAHINGKAKK